MTSGVRREGVQVSAAFLSLSSQGRLGPRSPLGPGLTRTWGPGAADSSQPPGLCRGRFWCPLGVPVDGLAPGSVLSRSGLRVRLSHAALSGVFAARSLQLCSHQASRCVCRAPSPPGRQLPPGPVPRSLLRCLTDSARPPRGLGPRCEPVSPSRTPGVDRLGTGCLIATFCSERCRLRRPGTLGRLCPADRGGGGARGSP